MQWFNKLRSASLQQQLLLLGAGVAVIGALLAVFYFSVLRTSYDVLFSNLRPQDAATIVAELDKRKIPYRLEKDGSAILAPQDQVAKLRLELMSTELPLKGTVGFELFNKSDMGLTEFAQQINYQRALQGELARTIMSLASVTEARVHLALPEHTIFAADRQPPKASVILMTNDSAAPAAGVVKGIQRLVAAAVPDLKVDDVVVLDGRGGIISGAAEPAVSGTVADDRSYLEQAYAATVQEALKGSFPSAQFDVAVWLRDSLVKASTEPSPDSPTVTSGRSYALRVAITPSTAVDMIAQNAIRNVAYAAVQGGPDDVILIHQPAAAEAPPASEAPNYQPLDKGLPIRPADVRTMIIGGGVLLILFAVFGIRRRDRATLTGAQRRRYATRLQSLLEAEA